VRLASSKGPHMVFLQRTQYLRLRDHTTLTREVKRGKGIRVWQRSRLSATKDHESSGRTGSLGFQGGCLFSIFMGWVQVYSPRRSPFSKKYTMRAFKCCYPPLSG